jgi:hypothetical protein
MGKIKKVKKKRPFGYVADMYAKSFIEAFKQEMEVLQLLFFKVK